MDVYGLPAPDCFPIDDLLDFSNDELFSTATANTDSDLHRLPPSSTTYTSAGAYCPPPNPNHSTDFTDVLCVPTDDVAELEWLSKFVDDSFTDFPANQLAGSVNHRPDTSFSGRQRSKRSKPASNKERRWRASADPESSGKRRESTSSSPSGTSPAAARRCTHCASEKTPQWRSGPLGPKTLCNACGVRFKSGRLVPEYRPAASPTFVLTQHSNSHRKVMELRRQKEEVTRQQHYHHHNFEVC